MSKMRLVAGGLSVILFFGITYVLFEWERSSVPQRERAQQGGRDAFFQDDVVRGQAGKTHNQNLEATTSAAEDTTHPKWLEPIILRVLNSEESWNESGNLKTITSIVEADFHQPWLRVEETYSVDSDTHAETLVRYVPSVADSILVKLNEGIQWDQLIDLEAEFNFVVGDRLRGTEIGTLRIGDYLNTQGLPTVIDSLLALEGLISIAEPDYLVRALGKIPNDPLFPQQVGLNNFNTTNVSSGDIDAPDGWDIRTSASSIVVAVLDSGINLDHEDLIDNLWTNPGEIIDQEDEDGNGYTDDLHGADFINNNGDPTDVQGHGTHVAGIIGAVGNNGIGVSGVAWDVQLMSLRFLDQNNLGLDSDAIEGIQYAIDQGADILNNSWGGSGYSELLEQKLQQASSNGMLIVTAAGNDGNRLADVPHYPASFRIPNQVVVGASNYLDNVSRFSNHDEELVHLFAPERALSTHGVGRSDYEELTGSSMSTAFVSGALALLREEFPAFTNPQLINRLLSAVEVKDSLEAKSLTSGRLNMNRALRGISNVPDNDSFYSPQSLEAKGGRSSGSLTFATSEPGEPDPRNLSSFRSVWFEWSSFIDSEAYVDVGFANYTGMVTIYEGTDITNLTKVDSQFTELSSTKGTVTFSTNKNSRYRIQVVTYELSPGPFSLEISVRPGNDEVQAAAQIEGDRFTVSSSNQKATSSPGTPQVHPGAAANDVWFLWTAPKSGTFYLQLENTLGRMFLNAFKNESGILETFGAEGDGGSMTNVYFTAEKNSEYYIGVASQSVNGSPFTLNGFYLGAVTIAQQPADQIIKIGETATFRVGVSSDVEPRYQWHLNNVPLVGETASVLKVFTTNESDLGDYFVTIKIADTTLTSQVANLSFGNIDLVVLEEPKSQLRLLGSEAILQIFLNLSTGLSIQWYKDDQPLSGANGNALRLSNLRLKDAGFYHAEVHKDGQNVSTTKFYLKVVEGPTTLAGVVWPESPWHFPGISRLRVVENIFFAWNYDNQRLGFSLNGSDWQYTILRDAGRIHSFSYGAGHYLAGTEKGIYISTNAANWERVETTPDVYQIAYGNGQFIAASEYGVFRSTDGRTWSPTGDSVLVSGYAVAYGNNRFICHQGFSTYSSSDGIVWEQITTLPLEDLHNLVFIDGQFWAGDAGFGALYKTLDGSIWSQIPVPDNYLYDFFWEKESGRVFTKGHSALWELIEEDWQEIVELPQGDRIGRSTFKSHKIYSTLDGKPGILSELLTDYEPENYPEPLRDYRFRDGEFWAPDNRLFYHSKDGLNWFRSANQMDSKFRLAGSANGNGVYIEVYDDQIRRSTDQENWETVGMLQDDRVLALKYLNDRFVLISPSSIRSSADGLNWHISEGERDFSPNFMDYGYGKYLRANQNGAIHSSTDAVNWTLAFDFSLLPDFGGLAGLVFFEDRFLITVGDILFESTDGISWKELNSDLQSHRVSDLILGNDILLIATDSGPFVWRNETRIGPLVRINGPPPGSTIIAGVPQLFDVQAFPRSHPIDSIFLSLDGVKISDIGVEENSFTFTPTTVGPKDLELVVVDVNGNQSIQPLSLTVVGNLTEATSANLVAPNDIVYYKGAFFGVGPGGIVYLSIDGRNWDRIQTPTSQNLRWLFENNIGLIAVNKDQKLLFSSNGIQWHLINDFRVEGNFHTQPKDFFVFESSGKLIYSTDGFSWFTAGTDELLTGYARSSPTNFKPQFFQSGSNFYRGAPGYPLLKVQGLENKLRGSVASFNDRLFTLNSAYDIIATASEVDWGIVAPGKRSVYSYEFQPVGEALFFLEQAPPIPVSFPTPPTRQPKPKVALVSFDGVVWYETEGPEVIGEITFNNGSYFCSNDLHFYESKDGIEWKLIGPSAYPDNSVNDYWVTLASPKGFVSLAKRLFVDAESTLSYSSNGTFWSRSTSKFPYGIERMIGGNDIGLGWGGWPPYTKINERRQWEESQNREISNKAVYGNGLFVDEAYPDAIRISIDGINWSSNPKPDWIPFSVEDFGFDGSRFWYFDFNDRLIGSSEDGINWTQKTYPDSFVWFNEIVRFKDRIYAGFKSSGDEGVTWEAEFDGTDLRSATLAVTDERLFALLNTDSDSRLFIHSGTGWVEGILPTDEHSQRIISNNNYAYYFGEWLWRTENGLDWEQLAYMGYSGLPMKLAQTIYLSLGEFAGIKMLSEADLALENLLVDQQELGLGDTATFNVDIRNRGLTEFTLAEDLVLEFLLTKAEGVWGMDNDGIYAQFTTSHPRGTIAVGEVISLTHSVSLPEEILPGKYYVAARIKGSSCPSDSISSNNYAFLSTSVITIPEKTLELTVQGEGQITTNVPVNNIPYKQTITLTPIPGFGYEFSHWSGDITSVDETLRIKMDQDKKIQANFVKRKFRISISKDGKGDVAGVPQNGLLEFGDRVNLNSEPEAGWTFLGWSGDKYSFENQLDVQVLRDLRFNARFGQGIQDWLAERYSIEELKDPSIAGLSADIDGNRYSNVLEYLFGIRSDFGMTPRFEVYVAGVDVCLLYQRSLTVTGEVYLEVRCSNDLSSWSADSLTERIVSMKDGLEFVEVRKTNPDNAPVFFEIRAISR